MKLYSNFDKPQINVCWNSNRKDEYISGFQYYALLAFPYKC